MVKFFVPLLLVASLLFGITPAFSGAVETFRVRQAVDNYPEVTAYADAIDIAGATVLDLKPDNFLATLGQHTIPVNRVEKFITTGQGVSYVFLVDISRSLSKEKFENIRSAIELWIDRMRDHDRAAIISFGEEVSVVQDYTADVKALKNGLKTLGPTDSKTRFHRGIHRAIELSQREDDALPTRKVIVTLSDGEDDFAGGMTREEVLVAMAEDRVPIYAIGFSNQSKGEQSLKKLGEFARLSGGEFYDGNNNDISSLYDSIQTKILSSWVIGMDVSSVIADGKGYRLQLTLKSGEKSFNDGLDLRVLPKVITEETPVAEPKVWYEELTWWVYVIIGVIVIFAIILIVSAKRKKKLRLLEEAEAEMRRQKRVEQKASEEAAKAAHDDKVTVKIAKQQGINIKFVVLSSSGESREYGVRLSTRSVIGRSKECDLTIDDDNEVSKRHCELLLEGGYVLLNDLNSTNGTFANGVPVKVGHRVKNGDLIMLGKTEMRMVF